MVRALGGLLEVRPAAAGLHLIGWLLEGVDDVAAGRAAAACGVEVVPLSTHTARPLKRSGLLGYAAFTPEQIRTGIATLAGALRAAIGTA